MKLGPLLVTVLIVGAMFAFFFWLSRKRKGEVAAARAATVARGWTWVERDDTVFAGLTPLMFSAGQRQWADDVIKAPDFVAYSFHWVTGRGDRKDTHSRRVAMLKTGVRLPMMEVVPQTIVSAAETAITSGDMDVELAAFNRAWSVRTTVAPVAHAVLHPRMIERFMDPGMKFRSVFFDQGWIGIVDNVVNTAAVVDHAVDAVAVAREVEALVPPHLVREYGDGEAGAASQ